jgi:predicted DNA-binding transcriptional regulator AlpA
MNEMNKAVGNRQQAVECPAALTANAKQVAAMLGVSVRQVWRLHTTGRLPKAIRLGNCVRWRRAEIEAFVEAGCPNRETWEGQHV